MHSPRHIGNVFRIISPTNITKVTHNRIERKKGTLFWDTLYLVFAPSEWCLSYVRHRAISTYLLADFSWNGVKCVSCYIVHSRTNSIALLAKWYQYWVKITNFLCSFFICMQCIYIHKLYYLYGRVCVHVTEYYLVACIGICACSKYCAYEQIRREK